MSDELVVYCMRCKTNRVMVDPVVMVTPGQRPATKGKCPVCGTVLIKMGEGSEQAGMKKATPAPAENKAPLHTSPPKKQARKGKLVIVESPAKVRTIENYLGKGFKVKASIGHVRDLMKSRLAIDVEHDFAPSYSIPRDKEDIVQALQKTADSAAEIYLATDPDREGEAIAWHLIHAANMDEERVRRVVFYEITKDAVLNAFNETRAIDMNLVNAQQARRILDRLVGYELSPLLWQKIRPKLSAGRVQSVAVRLIVEREREIEQFVSEEYWTIDAELARTDDRAVEGRISFLARLHRINDQEVSLRSEEDVRPVLDELEKSEYIVSSIKRGTRRRKPSAPFTTSTLQQEASRRLNFTATRTMRYAQQLYEGVDIGEGGEVGLITYMRTDSTNVSKQAQEEARVYIENHFGPEYLPSKPHSYGKKAKRAQEAHEAIRPTSVSRTPESLKPYLDRHQLRLYTVIWQRFLASQMAAAVYDTIRVDATAGLPEIPVTSHPYLFRASGAILKFPGFLAIYEDGASENSSEEDDLNRIFPKLEKNNLLDLLGLFPEQHFTQPPGRFSEATLVASLEEHGIGRPSTYAPILNTIQKRGYVHREGKQLHPTEVGIAVNDLLVGYFPEIVDVRFTARMEDQLDGIASDGKDWVPVIREFYEPFKKEVEHAREHAPNIQLDSDRVGRNCPECGHELMVRWGRYGKFVGCSDFPNCRYTEPWLDKIGIPCPECGAEIVKRKTRRGRTFYGCSAYPDCEWKSWKPPLSTPCPSCGGLLVQQSKEWAQCINCQTRSAIADLPTTEQAGQE
nr:type I DNA topoisomerase [Anaerolineae bacterium]